MKKSDKTTSLQELKDLVQKFGEERNWQRHHGPKNLAMNIAIEAAELMEHYVWEREGEPDREEVEDEVADVLFNLLNFAYTQKIDLSTVFRRKYQKLLIKYPVDQFKAGDDLKLYRQIKKAYRQKK